MSSSHVPERSAQTLLLRLGRFTVRRRRTVLVVSAGAFAIAQVVGLGAIDRLSSGGFETLGSESALAAEELQEHFGAGDPDLVLLVSARSGSVDDPAVAAAGAHLSDRLAREPGVVDVVSYWKLAGASPLRNSDGDAALIVVQLEGDLDHRTELAAGLVERYAGGDDVVDVRVGGFQEAFRQTVEQIEHDFVRAEMIAAPVLLILLLLVFRSVIAALLPLVVGAFAVAGTLFALRLIAGVTEVSVFALNLTTGLGLGLAVDYSLFVIARFREEVAAGRDRDEAVVRAVATAGRMVTFSALTVAASLSSLLVFPMVFLRSFAYAGVVALLAGIASVVTLPALLAVAGDRLDRWAVRRPEPRDPGTGWWHRIAVAVMRRPLQIATAVVVLLLVLGAPFLRMEVGLPDDRVLPADAPVRAVHDELRRDFDGAEGFPLLAVATGLPAPAERAEEVERYAAAVSELAGVLRVDAETGSYVAGERLFAFEDLARRFRGPTATYVSIVPSVEPISAESQRLARDVRAIEAPFDVRLTGRSAVLVDSKEALLSRLPIAAGLVAVVTFVVLLLAFGSVLVPVKALVLNVLSLTATFGAMVWVFQEGHLSSWLGFTASGSLHMAMPILMFAIAFGLSMDYELFLLSRIQEEYRRTGDNTTAVALGLERTGGLITAAAALVAASLLAVGTSGVSIIKMFGLGLALAVIADASLVRAALVPAVMRLASDANWWAPRWLSRLHARLGFDHAAHIPEVGPDLTPAAVPGVLP